MRSQVQVLAGPPPFSQVTALPAASRGHPLPGWAASGPHAHPARHAHRPRRARPPGRQPPRSPRSVVAYPAPTAATPAGTATSRRSLLRCPRTAASHGLRTPAWPTWSRSGHARPPAPIRPGRQRLALTNVRSRGVARPRLAGRPSRSMARRPIGPRPVPAVTVAQRHQPGPNAPVQCGRRRTRPGRRGGHRTGGHQPSGPPDPGRRTQVAGHRTAGHRTPGRRPRDGGHRMLDTDRATAAVAGVLAVPAAATTANR